MKIKIILSVLFFLNLTITKSQTVCPNSGFNDTTFTGWNAGTGDCSNYPTPTIWTNGIVSGPLNSLPSTSAQHDLLTCAACYDPNSGGTSIPYVSPGGVVSVRLGNSQTNSGTEYLSYQIPVTINNASFTYQYAVVLENGSGHSSTEQARFTVNVIDQNGNPISGPCGAYNIETNAASSDPTFFPFYVSSVFGGSTLDGYYKPWTSVTIDLTSYINTTVTIQFITQDCTLGGHYGYAYIDASCSQLNAQILFCPTDTICQVIAPSGFNVYQWYTSAGVIIPNATNETLSVTHPVIGQQYLVSMTSASGCNTTLTTTLAYSSMTLYQNHTNSICNNPNAWAYINQSGVSGPFTYTWKDSTTNNTVSQTDSLTNAKPGTYYVTVQNQTGCNKTDTVHIGNTNGFTITTSYIPINCHNDSNGSATVNVNGGVPPFSYLWSNGQTTNTINSLTSGIYCVKVVNTIGCVDSSCVIISNPSPIIAQFTTQPTETDITSPIINFTNQSTDSTTSYWTFGDGNTSISQNPLNVYSDVGSYIVTLIIKNSKGCKDSVSHTIIIDGLFTFYTPNSFTPERVTNSFFLPVGIGWDDTTFKMSIYDRWGNLIYKTDDVNKGWDGRCVGSIVQEDVYVWKASVKETGGKQHDYIGRVTVVK